MADTSPSLFCARLEMVPKRKSQSPTVQSKASRTERRNSAKQRSRRNEEDRGTTTLTKAKEEQETVGTRSVDMNVANIYGGLPVPSSNYVETSAHLLTGSPRRMMFVGEEVVAPAGTASSNLALTSTGAVATTSGYFIGNPSSNQEQRHVNSQQSTLRGQQLYNLAISNAARRTTGTFPIQSGEARMQNRSSFPSRPFQNIQLLSPEDSQLMQSDSQQQEEQLLLQSQRTGAHQEMMRSVLPNLMNNVGMMYGAVRTYAPNIREQVYQPILPHQSHLRHQLHHDDPHTRPAASATLPSLSIVTGDILEEPTRSVSSDIPTNPTAAQQEATTYTNPELFEPRPFKSNVQKKEGGAEQEDRR